jgi:tetratricopeptide (TPR) repeat protein/DNA-binding CsgD family transcriptional regulator
MYQTKEEIARSGGLLDLFELSAKEPKQALEAIARLRPELLRPDGLTSIANRKDALLAYAAGRALRLAERHTEALAPLTLASTYASSKDLIALAADCERELAAVCILLGHRDEGFLHAERSLAFAQDTGDSLMIANSKQQLAILYAMKGDDEESIQYFLEIISVYEKLEPKQLPRVLNNYAHHFFKRGDSESGLKLLEEAASYAEDAGGRAIYTLNIAQAQLDLGRHEDALRNAAKSVEFALESGKDLTLGKAKIVYAHALERLNETDQPWQQVNEAERCFERLSDLPTTALALVNRAKLAAMRGECAVAMEYLREAQTFELHDRVLWDLVFAQTIEEVQRSCANWAEAYSALKQYDKISDSLRAEHSTRLLYANPVGPLREHAKSHAENEALKAQLDRQAMELMTIRETTANVKAELDSIVYRASNRAEVAKTIRTKIGDIPESLDYQSFEQQFKQRYPSFTAALMTAHPDLTQVQLRICSVTRTGMRAPQAARLLHLSERTIQNHRYRLKKLLGLAEADSLSRYLKRF